MGNDILEELEQAAGTVAYHDLIAQAGGGSQLVDSLTQGGISSISTRMARERSWHEIAAGSIVAIAALVVLGLLIGPLLDSIFTFLEWLVSHL